MESQAIEYEVREIGSNALAGMLVRKDAQDQWYVAPVTGLDLVVNFEKCLVGVVDLAEQLAGLYRRGAKSVTLVQWMPAHERQVGKYLARAPRHRADEPANYTIVQANV